MATKAQTSESWNMTVMIPRKTTKIKLARKTAIVIESFSWASLAKTVASFVRKRRTFKIKVMRPTVRGF